MMGHMFNFLQTMMNSSVQSRPSDEIQIDYGVRRGRLAGMARNLAGVALSSGDALPRGPPLLGQAGFRRLPTIAATDPNIGDESPVADHDLVPVAESGVSTLALMDTPATANGAPATPEIKTPSSSLTLLDSLQKLGKKTAIKRPAARKAKAVASDVKAAGYCIEWSRNNVQARTGIAGPGQNKGFRFGGSREYKTMELAIKAAKKWLADQGCKCK